MNRLQNLENGTKYPIVAVEGSIGVGKTTFCECLHEVLRSKNIKTRQFIEKVNHSFLDLFLSDQKGQAWAFQLSMLESRINSQKWALHHSLNGELSILDRSIIGDRAFAILNHQKGYINEREMEVYNKIFDEVEKETLPNLIIYLDCPKETLVERITTRKRGNEAREYTGDFLENLNCAYETTLRYTYNIPITRIDWSENRDRSKIISEISRLIDNQLI